MNRFADVNWWSVLVAASSAFVIGALWYGPLFQKPWMRVTGITHEQAKTGNPALIFGGAFLLNLIAATGIAALIGPRHGVAFGLHVGAMGGFFFLATALGVIYLFEQRPLLHWLINAAYQVLAFAAMGAIIGAWPR